MAAFEIADAGGALALEQNFRRVHVGAHGEVRPLHGGMQEGRCGADAATVLDGALRVGDALLNAGVVVGVARNAQGLRAFDEGLAERMKPIEIGHRHGAVRAAVFGVGRADAVFQCAKVGQHVGVAPAAIAELRPGFVVEPLAAIVDVAVDGAGAAERLATWRINATPAGPFAGLHGVTPVHAFVVECLDEAGGDVDEGVPVARAGFEHADGDAGIFGELGRQHTASRTRTHDHVIECICHVCPDARAVPLTRM